jgi:hypothetical protein
MVAREEGVNVKVAKEMLNAVYMSDKPRQCKGPTLQAIDVEAKEMQQHLDAVPALQWIKQQEAYAEKLTKKQQDGSEPNPKGSFLHYVFELVECPLLLRVAKMLVV